MKNRVRVNGVGGNAKRQSSETKRKAAPVNAPRPKVVVRPEVATPGQAPEVRLVVKGALRNADGKPWMGGLVYAFDKDLRSEQLLGKARTDAKGFYEISYVAAQFARAEKGAADLIVQAIDPKGIVLAASPVLFNARPVEELNLTLPALRSSRSEYEDLLALLAPVMIKITPAELTKDDIAFLAGETGAPRERIGFLSLASQLGAKTKLPAEVFYGFARQGLPIEDLRRLLNYRIPVLRQALETAISANIVPKKLKREVASIMDRLRSLWVQ